MIASRSASRRLRSVLSLEDFEGLAKRHLPKPLFAYISSASETNHSLQMNAEAFRSYVFKPRVLRDVSGRTTTTTLFGQPFSAPVGIAPMGISALMAYRGDLMLAKAAEAAGIPIIMSGSSLIKLEDVIKAAPNSWFQAYLPGEPDRIDALVDRVQGAGFRTLLLTVDVATLANRENNLRAGFSTPLRPSARLFWQGLSHPSWTAGTLLRTIFNHGIPHFENSYATRGAPIISKTVSRDFGKRDHLNWEHFGRIRKRFSGNLVIKGIMHEDDADRAAASGADAIIVSNHGGRQLDGTMSPLMTLPGVVDRVSGRIPVMLDGGIRRGTDVLKAIALGARFVFIGRPFLYAAAIGGQEGVSKAIDILKTEIDRDMALLGICSLQEPFADLVKLRASSLAPGQSSCASDLGAA